MCVCVCVSVSVIVSVVLRDLNVLENVFSLGSMY